MVWMLTTKTFRQSFSFKKKGEGITRIKSIVGLIFYLLLLLVFFFAYVRRRAHTQHTCRTLLNNAEEWNGWHDATQHMRKSAHHYDNE